MVNAARRRFPMCDGHIEGGQGQCLVVAI
jgi:hypothetical protein